MSTYWARAKSTDVALEHNAKVGALQQILRDPTEIFGLIERLMPGVRELQRDPNLSGGRRRRATQKLSDRNLEQVNTRHQQAEIHQLMGIVKAQKPEEARKLDDLHEMIRVLENHIRPELRRIGQDNVLTPANKPIHGKAEKALGGRLVKVYTALIKAVRINADNLPINNGTEEDRLIEIEAYLNRLDIVVHDVQRFVGNYAQGEFNEGHISAAEQAIEAATVKIAGVRDYQLTAAESAGRREAATRIAEERDRRVRTLTQWYDRREEVGGNLHDRVRANMLLGILGEADILGQYNHVPLRFQGGLDNECEVFISDLRAVMVPGLAKDLTERYGDIIEALEADMQHLRENFYEGYVRPPAPIPEGPDAAAHGLAPYEDSGSPVPDGFRPMPVPPAPVASAPTTSTPATRPSGPAIDTSGDASVPPTGPVATPPPSARPLPPGTGGGLGPRRVTPTSPTVVIPRLPGDDEGKKKK